MVAIQDLVFAGHAVVLSTFTGSQIFCYGYDRGDQKLSWAAIIFTALATLLAVVYGGITAGLDAQVLK